MRQPDVVLIHPPSVFDFRERAIFYGPISDVIPSSPVFEMRARRGSRPRFRLARRGDGAVAAGPRVLGGSINDKAELFAPGAFLRNFRIGGIFRLFARECITWLRNGNHTATVAKGLRCQS